MILRAIRRIVTILATPEPENPVETDTECRVRIPNQKIMRFLELQRGGQISGQIRLETTFNQRVAVCPSRAAAAMILIAIPTAEMLD